MTDYRPICQCGERFRCHEMGVQVRYAQGMIQHGDRYRCSGCGHEIIVGLADPYREVKQ